jgi:DNA-binding MarR family transcriptional regulator
MNALSSHQLRQLVTAAGGTQLALASLMGVSDREIAALGCIAYSSPPANVSQVQRRLGLSAGATTELIDRLVAAGLVTRVRAERDARIVLLEVSDRAMASISQHLSPVIEAIDGITERLSPGHARVVAEFLAEVTAIYTGFASSERSDRSSREDAPS